MVPENTLTRKKKKSGTGSFEDIRWRYMYFHSLKLYLRTFS